MGSATGGTVNIFLFATASHAVSTGGYLSGLKAAGTEIKNGDFFPLPYNFIAWCLIKHRDNFSLTFTEKRQWTFYLCLYKFYFLTYKLAVATEFVMLWWNTKRFSTHNCAQTSVLNFVVGSKVSQGTKIICGGMCGEKDESKSLFSFR
jgi:hypothetical protein